MCKDIIYMENLLIFTDFILIFTEYAKKIKNFLENVHFKVTSIRYLRQAISSWATDEDVTCHIYRLWRPLVSRTHCRYQGREAWGRIWWTRKERRAQTHWWPEWTQWRQDPSPLQPEMTETCKSFIWLLNILQSILKFIQWYG